MFKCYFLNNVCAIFKECMCMCDILVIKFRYYGMSQVVLCLRMAFRRFHLGIVTKVHCESPFNCAFEILLLN